jgi:hypothetical protein
MVAPSPETTAPKPVTTQLVVVLFILTPPGLIFSSAGR